MKKHLFLSLFVFAIAISAGVCYSKTHNDYAFVKKQKSESVENFITKSEVAYVNNCAYLDNMAILNYGIVIEEQNSFTDSYILPKLNNKSLQLRVSYIWFHQDRRC